MHELACRDLVLREHQALQKTGGLHLSMATLAVIESWLLIHTLFAALRPRFLRSTAGGDYVEGSAGGLIFRRGVRTIKISRIFPSLSAFNSLEPLSVFWPLGADQDRARLLLALRGLRILHEEVSRRLRSRNSAMAPKSTASVVAQPAHSTRSRMPRRAVAVGVTSGGLILRRDPRASSSRPIYWPAES